MRGELEKWQTKKEATKKPEAAPATENVAFKKWEEKDITKIKSVDLKLRYVQAQKPVSEPSPVVTEVVQPVAEEPTLAAAAPAVEKPLAPPLPPEAKKGLWERFKERGKKITNTIFNRETGKVAGKVSYDTITSILGIKLATDAVYGLATGKGDLAQWWKGRKESKGSKEAITVAYNSLVESFEKVKENKVLAETESIEKRLADFKTQVESAKISSEAKKALIDRLWAITIEHQEDLKRAKEERDEDVWRVLEIYVQGKISGIKIAKDAMNFAFTATGLSMLRGVVYAATAVTERVVKAEKEYAKQTLDADAKESELKFVAKDVLINSAIETARALSGRGDKKGASVKTKIVDFIKALGTVARGFGIYGVAFSGTDLPEQSIDKLINQLKERGVAGAISDNFIQNTQRVWHLYTHPTEIFKGRNDSVAPKPEELHDVPIAPVPEQAAAPAESIRAIEHIDQPAEEIISPLAEAHRVDVVTLDDSEGVLHGGNKLMRLHPELFTHENGQPWTADEIHKWRVDELKEMGFKFKGDKWGYPMTVHGGAQVELFTGADGRPHFKLASDEHVTWHKNYKWVDTEPEAGEVPALDQKAIVEAARHRVVAPPAETELAPSPADRFAKGEHVSLTDRVHHAPKKGELMTNYLLDAKPPAAKPEMELLTDYPPEIKAAAPAPTPVEKTLAPARADETSVSAATAKPSPAVKAAAIETKAPVAPRDAKAVAEAAVSEVAGRQMSLPELLKERHSNPREFIDTYDKMTDATIEKWNRSFIFKGDSAKFLQDKINILYKGQNGITFANLSNPNLTDSASLEIIEKVLNTEDKFKLHQPDWTRDFRSALFDKNDKVMGLALAPDRDVLIRPIMTNDGHAARIWDPAEGKDVFIYDKDRIFKTDTDGQLVVEDEYGKTRVFTHEEALGMSEEP